MTDPLRQLVVRAQRHGWEVLSRRPGQYLLCRAGFSTLLLVYWYSTRGGARPAILALTEDNDRGN